VGIAVVVSAVLENAAPANAPLLSADEVAVLFPNAPETATPPLLAVPRRPILPTASPCLDYPA